MVISISSQRWSVGTKAWVRGPQFLMVIVFMAVAAQMMAIRLLRRSRQFVRSAQRVANMRVALSSSKPARNPEVLTCRITLIIYRIGLAHPVLWFASIQAAAITISYGVPLPCVELWPVILKCECSMRVFTLGMPRALCRHLFVFFDNYLIASTIQRRGRFWWMRCK